MTGSYTELNSTDHNGQALNKQFCPVGYKWTHLGGNSGADHTTYHTSAGADGHCIKCPIGQTSNGGESPSCFIPSIEWVPCTHMACHLQSFPARHCRVHTSANPFASIGSGTTAENADAVEAIMTGKTKDCLPWDAVEASMTGKVEKRIVTFHHGHEAGGVNHKCKLSGSSEMADADRRCSCVCSTGGL